MPDAVSSPSRVDLRDYPPPHPLATLGLKKAPYGLEIGVLRTVFTDTATRGLLFVNGQYWGHTLEDRLRPYGEKVFGETCIPAGQYPVLLAESPNFGKLLPRIQNVPYFTGVLFHGGNRPRDTLGCILIARHVKAADWIFGSLSKKLVQVLEKSGGSGQVTIWNGPGSLPYLTPTPRNV